MATDLSFIMSHSRRPGGSGWAGRARARPKVQPGRKRSGRLSTSPTKNSGPTGSGGPRPYQKLAQALPKIQPRRKRSGRLGSARPKIQARPKFRPGPDQMKSASAGPVTHCHSRTKGWLSVWYSREIRACSELDVFQVLRRHNRIE